MHRKVVTRTPNKIHVNKLNENHVCHFNDALVTLPSPNIHYQYIAKMFTSIKAIINIDNIHVNVFTFLGYLILFNRNYTIGGMILVVVIDGTTPNLVGIANQKFPVLSAFHDVFAVLNGSIAAQFYAKF